MKYGSAGQIMEKEMTSDRYIRFGGSKINISYRDRYHYDPGSDNPYAVRHVSGSEDGEFYWNKAGNMTFMKHKTNRLFFWTEDNRMQALITDHSAAFYRYDAGGERELKLLASVKDANVNGRDYKQPVYDYAVLYASGGLMTVDATGYKKHYFMEGERILTNIGGGGSPNIQPKDELVSIDKTDVGTLSKEYFDKYVSNYFINHVNDKVGNPLEIPGDLGSVPDLYGIFDNSFGQGISDIPFYYVPDYLSSGSVITNATGDPVHVLSYIPFGEILLDLNAGFETPYKFAGYEHDQESGLSYASARYYSSRFGIFTNTDPMWYKYPHLTSYNYCGNNPINRIDPTGTDWIMITNRNGGRSPVWDARVTNQATSTEYYGSSAYYLGREHQYTGVGNRQINLNTNGTWTDVTKYYKSVSNGEIQSSDITQNRITQLERKALKSVQGIVLHRTASSNTEGTIRSFQIGRDGVNYGTHFLVGKDGTIYQTASLENYTLHVGKTRNKSFPNNLNSIGIEVVGNYNYDTKTWEPLTSAQIEAVSNLTNYLMVTYKLPSSALYIHENISYKTEGEGGTVLRAIQPNIVKE